jgi:ParB family chromosome partitioning protein
VREMLQLGLCGDFEVLHCLNQIYEIEPTRNEFYRMRHSVTEGSPLSRDEARNTLARMKAWTQQQAELNTHGKKPQTKNKKEAAGTERQAQPQPPTDTEREQAEQDLAVLRKKVFDGGEVILAEFAGMKNHTAALGLELHDMEWVLYSGFLAMALPMLEGVGSDRGLAYLKKLQGELKGNTPQALLETLMLDRPAEWRL